MKKEDARKAYDALMKFYPLTLDDLDGEEWRDIRGYEGFYQVSNFGRVKSFWHGKAKIRVPKHKGKGYLSVNLSNGTEKKSLRIYRLVAENFIPNPDNKPQVNHIDGHPLNNHVSNLEWATNADNIQHAYDNGFIHRAQGEKSSTAKLTTEQALLIRENSDGLPLRQLAKKFGVSETTIHDIQAGRKYRNAGGKIVKTKPNQPRIPDDVRQQIRTEYVSGSIEFGATALAKKYGIGKSTVLKIVHEGDD